MFDGLPDLLLLIRRNGVLLSHTGGDAVPSLQPDASSIGRELAAFWPGPVADTIKQLVRRALAGRGTVDGNLEDSCGVYEARVSAQGPDRALCVIRRPSRPRDEDIGATGLFRPLVAPEERRGFVRRFTEAITSAALSERPMSVCVVHMDGLTDLARVIETQFAADVMQSIVQRLNHYELATVAENIPWFAGHLTESVLALVIESRDRQRVEEVVLRVCDLLRQPVSIGACAFSLTPYAGVAMLGSDASAPPALLTHASAAAAEARRRSSRSPCFCSDTVKLRSLARIDLGHELREAIVNRDIRLHYAARHELRSGGRIAAVGFMHWPHPLRGTVYPGEFLPLSESTGLSAALSRSAMLALCEDYPHLCTRYGAGIRVSFAPTRHHVLDETFVDDVKNLVANGVLPAEKLELRIDERTLLACGFAALKTLVDRGVQLVVGDFGRDSVSLKLLASVPLAGLQLDRTWTQGLPLEPQAVKLCRGAIGLANSLGLAPIATAVDSDAQLKALVAIGFTHGSGDLFGALSLQAGALAPPLSWPKAVDATGRQTR